VGSGAITAAKLPDEHVQDERLAHAVEAVLEGDKEALHGAWKAWQADHLHHLEHEEQVMMPLTMKTASSPESRARVVHDRLLTPSEKLPDFDWYVGWVVKMLATHGSAAQPAKVAVRVFAWGLQHACSAAQWNRLGPIVQKNSGEAIWTELVQQFGLDREGPIAAAP
jgi:hypothetical protein